MAGQVAILRLRDISKRYLATQAVDQVSLKFVTGEIHALVGENGAGKSTLIKIIGGVHQADEGEIQLDGSPVVFRNPREARAAGIETIPQEMQLVPSATVAENVTLGDTPTRRLFGLLPVVDRRRMRKRAAEALTQLGFSGSIDARVDTLSYAERQIVIIAKALDRNARVLILDEPTASLEQREAERLFAILDQLKAKGVAIVYVSHRLSEVVRLADRCTVLRDGRVVDVSARGDIDENRLIRIMTGRDLEERHRPHDLAFERVLLELAETPPPATGAVAASNQAERDDRTLVLHKGEVVGLGGLLGSGTTAMLRKLYGATTRPARYSHEGRNITVRRPASAIANGLGFVPGERSQGLVMTMSVRDNMALPLLRRGIWRGGHRRADLETLISQIIAALDIRPPDPAKAVRELSGGNQQKVLFARWLLSKAALLLLDEPTRGIDIGAKARIHRLMREFVEEGNGVLFASSELDEVVAISDTVFAVRYSQIVDRMGRDAGDYSEAALRRKLAEET